MSRLLSVLFAAALMVMPSAALAQTDGSIRGYIHDEQGAALPGVTVTATSPAAATPVTAVSDEQGFYRLLNLAPGTYSVSAELPGFSKFVRENVEMRAGLNLGVDVTLKIGTLSETIDVRGDSPLLETKEAGQAVNVSGEMQQSIPLAARRHWSEFLRFTPGAVSSETATDQASVFYIHGAGIVSFSTLVDGADMSSAVNPWQGYVALPDGSVADVQIKTSGLDAATPLGFGAASNVATLSGTNKLKGGFTYAYTPIQWVGNNQPGGSVQSMSVQQPEALLGGPIMKDKLWFFGSYRYRKGTLGISRAAADVSFLKAVDSAFTPFDNEIKREHLVREGERPDQREAPVLRLRQPRLHPVRQQLGVQRRHLRPRDHRRHRRGGASAVGVDQLADQQHRLFVEQQRCLDAPGEHQRRVTEPVPRHHPLGRSAERHRPVRDYRQRGQRLAVAVRQMDGE